MNNKTYQVEKLTIIIAKQSLIKLHRSSITSELLLVTRQNDNHSPHSCRVDNNPYRHDSLADKDTYRHDGHAYSLSPICPSVSASFPDSNLSSF